MTRGGSHKQPLEAAEHPSEAKGHLRAIIFWLAAAPVIYVLSIGPAILLLQRGVLPEQTYYRLYAPVLYAHNKSELFRNALEWYIANIWRTS